MNIQLIDEKIGQILRNIIHIILDYFIHMFQNLWYAVKHFGLAIRHIIRAIIPII